MAVISVNFFSHALKRATDYTAIVPIEPSPFPPLPGSPVPDKSKPFKTVYLLHGFHGNHRDWLYGTRINELSQIYNVAVICPSGENSFYIDDNRRDAYYERMLCYELPEHTRALFPLSHERSDTMLSGLSMGGYGALRNGLKNPQVFGSIAAFSSALITDGVANQTEKNPLISDNYFLHTFGETDKIIGSDVDPKAVAKNLVSSGEARPKLMMACGTEDFLLEHNRDLDRYLTEIGYEHTYLEGPGGHEWSFWDTYVEKALEWFTGIKKPVPHVF